MYDVGARKVLVMGTGPMGCVPAELAQRSRAGECSVELQRAANLFNPQLNDMLKGLNDEKGGNIFVAANTMKMHMDYISNPQAYGTKSLHSYYSNFVFCNLSTLYNGFEHSTLT